MPPVLNGDFESTPLLTGWSATPASAVSVTTLFPHQGLYAAQMTASTIGSAVTLSQASPFVAVLPATPYVIDFSLLWYVDYRQAQTFSLVGTWYSGLGPPPVVVSTFTLPVVANFGVDQYTAYATPVITSPAAAAFLGLQFELDAGSQPVSLFVDDVTVTQVSG